MKVFLLAAFAALMMNAQEGKLPTEKPPAAKPVQIAKWTIPASAETPTERGLTEAESLKLQLLAAKIQLVQDKYKIEDFQKEIQPLVNEQEALASALCGSVGIPAAKIKTECGLNLGGAGPDGKPQAAKVWWQKPQAVAMPQAEKK